MPVWSREAEVTERSVRGKKEEEGKEVWGGHVFLAVALCSPVSTGGGGELGC